MNHYDGPIRNTEQHLDRIYYTLFCRCTALLHLFFISHGIAHNYVEPRPFSWAKLAYFGFSSSNFTVQDRIPRTAGDALRCLSSLSQGMTLLERFSFMNIKWGVYLLWGWGHYQKKGPHEAGAESKPAYGNGLDWGALPTWHKCFDRWDYPQNHKGSLSSRLKSKR